MSKNPIFDIIEDEVIKALELGVCLPDDLELRLDNESFKVLTSALIYADTKKQVPADLKRCRLSIAGIYVLIAADSDAENTYSH